MSQQIFSAEDRAAIWETYNRQCFYCNIPLEWKNIEIDHLLPEHLKNKPAELSKIISQLSLADSFDVLSYENLVPSCRNCNKSKHGDVLPHGQLSIMLNKVSLRLDILEVNKSKIARRSRLDRIMSAIAVAAANGTLTSIDAAAALSKLDPNSPAYLPSTLKFLDGVGLDEIRPSNVPRLLNVPVVLGTGDSDGFEMQHEDSRKIIVRTVNEWKTAIADEFYAPTTFDMKMEAFVQQAAGILDAMGKWQPADRSFIENPRCSVCDLHLMPSSFIPLFGEHAETAPDEILNLKTLREGVDQNIITVNWCNSHSIQIEYGGMAMTIWELLRGDMNNDGIEDILVASYMNSTTGTLGFGMKPTIITRMNSDEVFSTLK